MARERLVSDHETAIQLSPSGSRMLSSCSLH